MQSWCFLLFLAVFAAEPMESSMQSNLTPCLYEGHLSTDKDWYGYLANITIMDTGKMTYEFSYPAEKCCQNIFLYLEDQVSILNARMNCWQKEALLRPENDQILRLTPRFAWSGCHMTHPNGVSTYVCEGGRSFSSTSNGEKPTTWYLAVSNCASLLGLELKYKLEVTGHIGECKHAYKILTTEHPLAWKPTPGEVVARDPGRSSMVADNACVIEGTLNVTENWHGFFANVSLQKGGGFRFRFEYPYKRQKENVILYYPEDIHKLGKDQSCWQKEGVIRSRQVPDQILDLSHRSSWNGCISRNTSTGLMLICQGERHYNRAKRLYMAVSNCRSRNGLWLNYKFEVFGYEGKMCAGCAKRFALSWLSLAVIVILFHHLQQER